MQEWRRHNWELRERTKQPHICQIVKGRRIQWAGHVARMVEERMPRSVFLAQIDGHRPPGRPRKDWRRCLEEDMEQEGVNPRDWMILAQDNHSGDHPKVWCTSRQEDEHWQIDCAWWRTSQEYEDRPSRISGYSTVLAAWTGKWAGGEWWRVRQAKWARLAGELLWAALPELVRWDRDLSRFVSTVTSSWVSQVGPHWVGWWARWVGGLVGGHWSKWMGEQKCNC